MTHGISSNSNNHMVPFFLIICNQASTFLGLVNETMPWCIDYFVIVVFCVEVRLKEL